MAFGHFSPFLFFPQRIIALANALQSPRTTKSRLWKRPDRFVVVLPRSKRFTTPFFLSRDYLWHEQIATNWSCRRIRLHLVLTRFARRVSSGRISILPQFCDPIDCFFFSSSSRRRPKSSRIDLAVGRGTGRRTLNRLLSFCRFAWLCEYFNFSATQQYFHDVCFS